MDDLHLRTPAGGTPQPAATAGARGKLWVALAGCVAVLCLGLWFVAARLPQWLASSTSTPPAVPVTTPGSDTRRIQATLYYVSDDGASLVAVNRDVTYGATPAEQATRLIEAEVEPPPNERVSAIPKGTTVRSVFLTSTHDAYVDLGGTIASGQTGGSLDEALTVYAIVNTLTTNLPDITGVQILVNGKEVDTLAGHLDLRAPLGKAADWIQKGP